MKDRKSVTSLVSLPTIFSLFTIHYSLFTVFLAFALCLALPLTAFGADKLLVKDAAGTTTKFVVQDTGYTGIGTSGPTSHLQISEEGVTVNPKIIIDGAANSATTKPMIAFYRSRGTHAAPTALQNNDWLGQFTLNGHNGTAFEGERRVFQVEASENWTPTAGGYRFTFYTRANGTVGAPTARVTFDNDGTVKVGNLAGTYTNGSAYVCVNNSGVIYASEAACP